MQDFRQLSLIKIHISLLTTYNEIQLEERYNFLYFSSNSRQSATNCSTDFARAAPLRHCPRVTRSLSLRILVFTSSGTVPISSRSSSTNSAYPSAFPSALPSALLILLVSCTSYVSKFSNSIVKFLRSTRSVKSATSPFLAEDT